MGVCARGCDLPAETPDALGARGDCLFAGPIAEGFLGASSLRLDPVKPRCWRLGGEPAPWQVLSLSRGAHAWQQGDGADCAMTASCCCDCAAACEEALATIKICKWVAAVRADSMDWPSYCGSSACGASHAFATPLQRSLRSAAPQIVC